MNFSTRYFLIVFCSFLLSCGSSKNAQQKNNVLSATSLEAYGRYRITNNQELELISSAVHFGFSFDGNECRLFASINDANGHNYLQYELDGVYQKRIRVEGNSKEPITIAAPAAGKHTVWIYKATEAHTGPIFIQKIEGENIKAIPNPKVPLIEFIGNSITCGAAADPSEIPCNQGAYHDHHNAYYAYGPRVARALKANYIVSGVSGIGVYRNWNSDGPTMPQVYEKTDFHDNSTDLWKFSTYAPQIVSIALGTNDFSNGDGRRPRQPFDSVVFTNTYVQFVQLIKSKYPNAQIALLSSAMVNGERRSLLQNCLQAVKSKIDALYPNNKPVALYFFQPMQARGCSGHPNIEDHAILANELLPFFKQLLQ
jgi:lysophospholipase L1-like esterase